MLERKNFQAWSPPSGWLPTSVMPATLLVFDATVYLPNEGRNAQAEFAEGHIPGAGFFDIDAIADNETSLPHMVPASGRFEHLVGALGISNASRVIMYDQKGLFSAPRAWWLLRLSGRLRCWMGAYPSGAGKAGS